ncbi:hypothetical protein IWQ57_004481 [Coemansia nantahalensis]|uniref:Uncharacterized protein n=1 Tax=Coemansia nantahalensis TaxID=2789366 RepID=A0ACC1JS20_9FUNG|nr:hypothetical protein IWQ57_004481 [Coemansia nantahalensis]
MPSGTIFVVFVHNDNGTLKPVKFALTVDDTTTVFHMKQALKLQLQMSTWRMDLGFNTVELSDPAQRLFDTGIPLDSHLLLTLDTGDINPRKAVDELIAVIDVRQPYF